MLADACNVLHLKQSVQWCLQPWARACSRGRAYRKAHRFVYGVQSGRRSFDKMSSLEKLDNLQVSRVKRLPIPAESTQLLGKEFVGEEGRGANLIDIFGGAVEVRVGFPETRV